MPIITCANLPWQMTRLRRPSTTLNATASAAAALAYTNIGTMGLTRSTHAIWEKRKGLNFSKSDRRNMLERSLPPIGGVAQLQTGSRLLSLPRRQDEPDSGFFMLRGGIAATGNCVIPIILGPVQRLALSRHPLQWRPAKNTGTNILCLL